MVSRLRIGSVGLVLAAGLLLAACGGGNAELATIAPAVGLDASQIESAPVQIGRAAALEKRGRFGPDLAFVIRLPEQWNGRLLIGVTSPDAAVTALDELLADALVEEGVAYAALGGTRALDAPAIYRAFLNFVDEQIAAHYGRAADRRYLAGTGLPAAQLLRLLEGETEIVDGALLVAPRSWPDILRDYPAWIRGLRRLEPAFPTLASGSLATLSAAQVQAVQRLLELGLPPGSEAAWPDALPLWTDRLTTVLALVDPAYTELREDYRPLDRPLAVQDVLDGLDPRGRLTARTIVLQGGLDRSAPPAWLDRLAQRAAVEERAEGLARHVFPAAGGTLLAAGESAQFARARVDRGWETLPGWVEDGLTPGPVLGVEPSPPPSG